LGVVTKDGKIIFPDRQLMLFAADVLSRNAGAEIIFDVKSTRNLFPWIREHGGKPTLWKTGHSLVKAKMRETGALLAGEMSGHVFFKERWYGFDDGLYAGARLLEILSQVDDASATLNALPDAVCTPELHIPRRRRTTRCLRDCKEPVSDAKTSSPRRTARGYPTASAARHQHHAGSALRADSEAALQRIGTFRKMFRQAAPHCNCRSKVYPQIANIWCRQVTVRDRPVAPARGKGQFALARLHQYANCSRKNPANCSRSTGSLKLFAPT
jgi:phosphomannomutase/phosphoglucomutase